MYHFNKYNVSLKTNEMSGGITFLVQTCPARRHQMSSECLLPLCRFSVADSSEFSGCYFVGCLVIQCKFCKNIRNISGDIPFLVCNVNYESPCKWVHDPLGIKLKKTHSDSVRQYRGDTFWKLLVGL